MADATISYGGSTVTLKGATVAPGRQPAVNRQAMRDGSTVVTEFLHGGLRAVAVQAQVDAAGDVDKLDEWAKQGYECTFTSDITGDFTTDALGTGLVTNFSCGRLAQSRWVSFTFLEV